MSFRARVEQVAFEVLRDPASSPEDRHEARDALIDPRGAAVAKLTDITAKLTPNEREVLRRVAALIAGVPAPVDLRARTVHEHIAAILELDPTLDEVRRVLTREDPEEDLEPTGPGVIVI